MSDRYGSYPYSYSDLINNLYKIDNGICPLCGKKVNRLNVDSINIDHIVPQIVFKYAHNTKLNNLCNGYANLILVHKTCNVKKGIDFLDADKLYLNKHRKEAIKKNIEDCKEYIDNFNKLRNEKVKNQGERCAICQAPIKSKDAILRRLDCSKMRSYENSAAICSLCNQNYSRYKNRNIDIYITIEDFKKINV